MNDAIRGSAETIATALQSAGYESPVLIVADTATITRHAPAWARSFAAMDWKHRVRQSEGPADSRETESLATELASLGARTLVATGDAATLAAAHAAASRTETPCVVLSPP